MKRQFALAPMVLALAAALAGCGPQDKAAGLRKNYSLELKEVAVKELKADAGGKGPLGGANAAADALADKAAATDAADPAALPVLPDAPEGPRRVEVNFGILLKRSVPEALPGITLDIAQIDPFKKAKKTYRHYLELPAGAPMLQDESYHFTMVADEFVDGDKFEVTIRPEVPPADRAAYRELQ